MVYTVTFNPSLDYIVTVDDFRTGITNRTTSELMLPGGKGINASIVLSNLGVENTAFYFAAGFVGDEITRRVKESGIRAEAVPVEEGCSRINLKLKSIDGTEINGSGPKITDRHVEALLQKLDGLTAGDTLVLAGSIPSSMPKAIYSDIMQRLQGKGIRMRRSFRERAPKMYLFPWRVKARSLWLRTEPSLCTRHRRGHW